MITANYLLSVKVFILVSLFLNSMGIRKYNVKYYLMINLQLLKSSSADTITGKKKSAP